MMNSIIAHKNASGLTTFNSTNDTHNAVTVITPLKKTRRYTPRARKCARKGCDVMFTPKAKHGKYCSDICRKRDFRRRQRRLHKPEPRKPELALFTCEYCTQTFLAAKNSGAKYCKPYHKTLAYKKRKAATVQAIMGDMGIDEQAAADGLELSGMKQATAYFVEKGYQYDARRRAWVMPVALQEEMSVTPF